MALIKCAECGKEISDKAHSCPHCGFPLDYLKEEKIIKEEKSVKVIRNTISIKSLLMSLGICFGLFLLLIFTPIVNKGRVYELVKVLNRNNVLLLGALYGFSILIAFSLSIINRTTMKVSKLFYIQSLLIYITMVFLLYKNDFFISLFYILNYLCISVLIIIPNKFKKKEQDVFVSKKEEEKIKKNNEKILKDNKYFNKIIIIITGIILLAILITTSIILFVCEKKINANHITSYSIETSSDRLKITIITDELRVRKCAGFNCDEIGYVKTADEFKVNKIFFKDGYTWYLIEDFEGNEGYVGNAEKTNYLKVEYLENNDIKESYLTLNNKYNTDEDKESVEEEKETVEKTTKTETSPIYYEEENNYQNTYESEEQKPSEPVVPKVEEPIKETPIIESKKVQKKENDATPEYKCNFGSLQGTECVLKTDALAQYSCPNNYHVTGRFCVLDSSYRTTSPSCRCTSGRLIGNKCSSSFGTSEAICSCPSGYYYDGLTCSYSGSTIIDADVDYYYCNEDGILNGNMCTYKENATITGYTCPEGYTLFDTKCIEN